MNKIYTLLILSTLSFNLMAGGEGWLTNFEDAKKQASLENKSLLVDFTGSDWCGYCIKLKEEVFDKKEFADFAKDKFILVELDFPSKKKQDPAIKAQNAELGKKYRIQGYPTILLMDAKGRPFAKTGYQSGGPSAYNQHLMELIRSGEKITQNLTTASKLTGLNKAKMLIKTLKLFPEELLIHYTEEMDEIKKLDPKDSTGFIKEMKLKKDIKELQTLVSKTARNGELERALSLVDDFISKNALKGESKQQALMSKLNCYDPRKPGSLEKAEALMDSVIAIAPNSQSGQYAAAIKQRIKEMKEQNK